MTIQFIDNPPFIVDFADFSPKACQENQFTLNERIQRVAVAILTSVSKAVYLTAINSGTSFKQIVLGFYGSWENFRLQEDFYLVVFKIVYWAAAVGFCAVKTSYRLFQEKIYPKNNSSLSDYNAEIDMQHIRSNEVALDASQVPPTVKVEDLEAIFDTINFEDDKKLGYMPPLSRTEAETVYSVEELKAGLKNFTSKVDQRVAFLGTPPAYDTPRLMSFYQQIEDAVRLSIHKSNQGLAAFEAEHGQDKELYDQPTMKKYKNILEDRSRLVIDLAIAGKHCGARFMGEAMTVYYNFYGDNIKENGTLEDHLIELLASKRKAIAEMEIQSKMGFNTHSYNKYMSNMGPALAIPGTKNIIEHLDDSFNQNFYMDSFFKIYNVDYILDTIQNETKSSGPFRMKMTDWVKDQSKNWKKEEMEKQSPAKIAAIEAIIKNDVQIDQPQLEDIDNFLEVIAESKKQNIPLPAMNDWQQFLEETFALDQAKEWSKVKFPGKPVERLKRIKKIKDACAEKELGTDFTQLKSAIANNTPVSKEDFIPRLKELEKMKGIRKIIPLPDDTIGRILTGQAQADAVVADALDLDRRNEFIGQMKLDKLKEEGLSKAQMEWLVVSHQILMPQQI